MVPGLDVVALTVAIVALSVALFRQSNAINVEQHWNDAPDKDGDEDDGEWWKKGKSRDDS